MGVWGAATHCRGVHVCPDCSSSRGGLLAHLLAFPPPSSSLVASVRRLVTLLARAAVLGSLDHWCYRESPVVVFQAVYTFLTAQASAVSGEVLAGLSALPLVPVGSRLVRANTLYQSVQQAFAPYIQEVRAFSLLFLTRALAGTGCGDDSCGADKHAYRQRPARRRNCGSAGVFVCACCAGLRAGWGGGGDTGAPCLRRL